jgi:hypothetical protein
LTLIESLEEAAKWLIILAIAVWLSIAQIAAWRRPKMARGADCT